MTMFIIQSLLLLAIAYLAGCILGSLLKRWFSVKGKAEETTAVTDKTAELSVPAEPKPEPVPVAKPKAEPATKPAPAPAPTPAMAAAPATKDNLKKIKGIGPQNESRLNSIGIQTFEQIAAWSKKEQEEIGERLAFPGRIEREEWVKQAKELVKGDPPVAAKSKAPKADKPAKKEAKPESSDRRPPALPEVPEGGADNLALIEGVGNAIERKLYALGIYTFSQMASWSKDQQAWIGEELGFPGRPERENWVAEAKNLAEGGTAGKAKSIERGEIRTSKKSGGKATLR